MELNYTFYIAASAKKVWNIITSEEGTEQIFYGAKLKSSFEQGADLSYVGPGRDGEETLHIYGKVLSFIPNVEFSHTSIVGEIYRGDKPAYESRIAYKISDMGSFIKLDIKHDRWNVEDPSYENTKNNWWLMLSNIKTLAETGHALDIGVHE